MPLYTSNPTWQDNAPGNTPILAAKLNNIEAGITALDTANTVRVAARPVNIQDQANPLANAIADGGSHILSSRFASLAAAQAVFGPTAVLTDEIDYWALQSVVNNASKAVLGGGTLLLNKTVLIPAGGNREIEGEGADVSILRLKNGGNTAVVGMVDEAVLNPNVSLRRFAVDGNKANNATGLNDGLKLAMCSDLRIVDVEVFNCRGNGIWHHGLSGGASTRVQRWENVHVHDNYHWGIHNSNNVREVIYTGCTANANGTRTDLTGTGGGADSHTGGFLMDHSECIVDSFSCRENGMDGMWIRNVFTCDIRGLKLTHNMRHGLHVLGFVDSVGTSWVCQGNGTGAGTAYDIWWDSTGTMNYGPTQRSIIAGLVVGQSTAAVTASQGAWSGSEQWAMFFDDNSGAGAAWKVRDVVANAGSTGTVRLPTAMGNLTYTP